MTLLIIGLGYCGRVVAQQAVAAGMQVMATSRTPEAMACAGVAVVGFQDAGGAIGAATHLLMTAAPGEAGDPLLARFGDAVRGAQKLAWMGYLSTTGVYGDRQGGWVDEATEPAPGQARSCRRVAAEMAWRDAAGGRALDIMRLAGIYGPGRSALDEVRAGRARRILQPGHAFGRVHVEDIGRGVVAAMARPPQGTRVLNFADDEPAESAEVIAEAARLLGMAVPPGVSLAEAWPGMSEMARSFWSENRRVRSAMTQAALGIKWAYPSYREGLRAILAADQGGLRDV